MENDEKKVLQDFYLKQLPELEEGLEQIQKVIDIMMFSNIPSLDSQASKAIEMKKFYENCILMANGKFPADMSQ